METLWSLFGKNIGLSIAGLLGYGLVVYGRKLKDYTPKSFWIANEHFVLWAVSLQLLYSFVMALFPELERAVAVWLLGIVKAIFPAFDLQIPEGDVVTAVYLLGGWFLSLLAKRNTSKKDDNAR